MSRESSFFSILKISNHAALLFPGNGSPQAPYAISQGERVPIFRATLFHRRIFERLFVVVSLPPAHGDHPYGRALRRPTEDRGGADAEAPKFRGIQYPAGGGLSAKPQACACQQRLPYRAGGAGTRNGGLLLQECRCGRVAVRPSRKRRAGDDVRGIAVRIRGLP